MTQDEFAKLKNPAVFEKNYLNGSLLSNPEVLRNTKASIVNLMDDIAETLKAFQASVSVHCLWEPYGHVSNSRHYQGIACDFHIVSTQSYFREIETLESILDMMKVSHAVGLGLYPEWNHRGFHIDTRGSRGRWGYAGGNMVGYDEARRKAAEKY